MSSTSCSSKLPDHVHSTRIINHRAQAYKADKQTNEGQYTNQIKALKNALKDMLD
jgi:hypothetical protein